MEPQDRLEAHKVVWILDHYRYYNCNGFLSQFTVDAFKHEFPFLTTDLLNQLLEEEYSMRSKLVEPLKLGCIVDYIKLLINVKPTISNSEIDTVLLGFRSLFDLTLQSTGENFIKFSSNLHKQRCDIKSRKKQVALIHERCHDFSNKDIFYFDEIHVKYNALNFTISIANNVVGDEFLDPLFVSNLNCDSFNYHPLGANNTVHFQLYLQRINCQLKAANRTILLILHNNVDIDLSQFSQIKPYYLSIHVDKYFQKRSSSVLFPDEFGLSHWIKTLMVNKLSTVATNNPQYIINALLKTYYDCVHKLKTDPVTILFNKLNIRKSKFLSSQDLLKLPQNGDIIEENGMYYLPEVPKVGEQNTADYKYSVRDIYYSICCLNKYSIIKTPTMETSPEQIIEFFVDKLFPFLSQNDASLMEPTSTLFNSFMSKFGKCAPLIDSIPEFAIYDESHSVPMSKLIESEGLILKNVDFKLDETRLPQRFTISPGELRIKDLSLPNLLDTTWLESPGSTEGIVHQKNGSSNNPPSYDIIYNKLGEGITSLWSHTLHELNNIDRHASLSLSTENAPAATSSRRESTRESSLSPTDEHTSHTSKLGHQNGNFSITRGPSVPNRIEGNLDNREIKLEYDDFPVAPTQLSNTADDNSDTSDDSMESSEESEFDENPRKRKKSKRASKKIKKSKIMEILKVNKLDFVTSVDKSVFSDESEDSENDSLVLKVIRTNHNDSRNNVSRNTSISKLASNSESQVSADEANFLEDSPTESEFQKSNSSELEDDVLPLTSKSLLKELKDIEMSASDSDSDPISDSSDESDANSDSRHTTKPANGSVVNTTSLSEKETQKTNSNNESPKASVHLKDLNSKIGTNKFLDKMGKKLNSNSPNSPAKPAPVDSETRPSDSETSTSNLAEATQHDSVNHSENHTRDSVNIDHTIEKESTEKETTDVSAIERSDITGGLNTSVNEKETKAPETATFAFDSEKPKLTKIALTGLAIILSEEKKLDLRGIGKWIASKFKYFETVDETWHKSLAKSVKKHHHFTEAGLSKDNEIQYSIKPEFEEKYRNLNSRLSLMKSNTKQGPVSDRPPYSYPVLISAAMLIKGVDQINKQQVVEWVMHTFEYYRRDTKWQHNITKGMNKRFIRLVPEGSKKPVWKMRPEDKEFYANSKEMKEIYKIAEENPFQEVPVRENTNDENNDTQLHESADNSKVVNKQGSTQVPLNEESELVKIWNKFAESGSSLKIEPPYDLEILIGISIIVGADRRLRLSQITKWIAETFDSYDFGEIAWQATVLRTLSSESKIFKEERSSTGVFYTILDDYIVKFEHAIRDLQVPSKNRLNHKPSKQINNEMHNSKDVEKKELENKSLEQEENTSPSLKNHEENAMEIEEPNKAEVDPQPMDIDLDSSSSQSEVFMSADEEIMDDAEDDLSFHDENKATIHVENMDTVTPGEEPPKVNDDAIINTPLIAKTKALETQTSDNIKDNSSLENIITSTMTEASNPNSIKLSESSESSESDSSDSDSEESDVSVEPSQLKKLARESISASDSTPGKSNIKLSVGNNEGQNTNDISVKSTEPAESANPEGNATIENPSNIVEPIANSKQIATAIKTSPAKPIATAKPIAVVTPSSPAKPIAAATPSSPAKSTPAKSTPVKATPAKADKVTPAKATTAKATPAKPIPSKSSSAKSSPVKPIATTKPIKAATTIPKATPKSINEKAQVRDSIKKVSTIANTKQSNQNPLKPTVISKGSLNPLRNISRLNDVRQPSTTIETKSTATGVKQPYKPLKLFRGGVSSDEFESSDDVTSTDDSSDSELSGNESDQPISKRKK